MNTVKVVCPSCCHDVTCPVETMRVFLKGDTDLSIHVLFECPSCHLARIQPVSVQYLDRLVLAGVRIADTPDEMQDPVRVADSKPVQADDVLDFIIEMQSTQWLAQEAQHG